jgi:hypothetical protein
LTYAKTLAAKLREQNLIQREQNGYWFPSQLGGCDRQSVLAHSGVEPNPKTDDELRNLWLGSQIHAALQSNLPFELLGSEKSARCRDETFRLSGKLDALIRNSDGEVEAVEFKSVLKKKFNYDLPMEDHVWQVGCYLTFPIVCLHEPDAGCSHEDTTTPFVHPQPEVARIVYWAKEDAEIREFFVYPSEELEKKVKGELVRLEGIYQDYLATKRLPAPVPASSWRLKNRAGKVYCDFVGKGCCADVYKAGGEDELPVLDSASLRGVRSDAVQDGDEHNPRRRVRRTKSKG